MAPDCFLSVTKIVFLSTRAISYEGRPSLKANNQTWLTFCCFIRAPLTSKIAQQQQQQAFA